MSVKTVGDYFKNSDIIVSNVPGCKEDLIICGKKVVGLSGFANLQHDTKLFVVPQTFNNQMRFTMIAKDNLKMDTDDFFKILSNKMKSELEKFA